MSLIILIGLPGSGKTTYCKELAYKNYMIHDDFITKFFDGSAIASLEKIKLGVNVCLSDPRLCLPDIFNRYIATILKYVDRTLIQLVLYENNPEQCIENIEGRGHRHKIIDTIQKYSAYYDLYNYQDFVCTTKPVFHTSTISSQPL